MLRDVATVAANGQSAIILALNDFQNMIKTCLRQLRKAGDEVQMEISQKNRTVNLLKAGRQKMTFLMSWTNKPDHALAFGDLRCKAEIALSDLETSLREKDICELDRSEPCQRHLITELP